MALSGAFNTGNYGGRYLRFEWTATQNIANNTSTINWTLKGAGKGEWTTYKAGNFKVVIDGATVYTSATRIDLKENTLVASGSKVITHNTNGKRSFSASAEGGIYYVAVNCTGNGSWDLTDIPRAATITEAPNFNDEENPTIKYSNPAGNNVTALEACISFTGAKDDIAYRSISKTGSTYTFPLTDAERKVLRANTTDGNSRKVIFFVRTTIGNVKYHDTETKDFTIINGLPTIAPTIIDEGSTSVALTGNPNTMIKYFNHMTATINSTPKKEATISKNFIKCGENVVEASSYSFLYANSNKFKFTTIDNRGNQVSKEVEIPMVEYIPLTCDIEADVNLDSVDGTKASIEFTIKGNYFNGSFGAVNNSLVVSYTLTNSAGEVIVTKNLVPAANDLVNGTYTVSDTISDLDYKTSYVITAKASDEIAKDITATSKALRATPVFDWGEEDFNFNVPVKINNTEVDYPVEQGVRDGWTYRKWNSGLAECWKTMSVSGIDQGEFNLNGFYYCGSKGVNFPFTFKTVTYTNATGGSTGNMNFIRPFNYSTSDMTYIVMGLADLSSVTVIVNLEAKGTWK